MRSPSAVVINHKQVQQTFLGWVHINFQLVGVPLWSLIRRPVRLLDWPLSWY
jgi:hypothetical protein